MQLQICLIFNVLSKHGNLNLSDKCTNEIENIFLNCISQGQQKSQWSRAFSVLPFLVPLRSPQCRGGLYTAVDTFITHNLPFSSVDVQKNVREKDIYAACVECLLACLVTCKDSLFFGTILPFLCADREHFMRPKITLAIQKFSNSVESKGLVEVVQKCFAVIFDDVRYAVDLRENVADLVLFPFVQKMPAPFFIDVCASYLKQIIEHLRSDLVNADLEEECRLRGILFRFINIMYSRLGPELLNGTVPIFAGRIVAKSGKEMTGKDLTKELILLSFGCKNLSLKIQSRAIHQSAFQLLCTIICRTQSKPEVFNGYIFKEDAMKDQLFWRNIVDPNETIVFPVEVKAKEKIYLGGIDSAAPRTSVAGSNLKSISTQYLKDSSFSQVC